MKIPEISGINEFGILSKDIFDHHLRRKRPQRIRQVDFASRDRLIL
jgi:hypothetical protein